MNSLDAISNEVENNAREKYEPLIITNNINNGICQKRLLTLNCAIKNTGN